MNTELYRFLTLFKKEEAGCLEATLGLPAPAASEAADLLMARLIKLTAPLAGQVYQDALEKMAPTVIPGLSFASEEQKIAGTTRPYPRSQQPT